jgi:hypothetical protein
MDTFTKMTVEERISTIHYTLKDMFPEATSVNVFVNSEGINVTPVYRTNISGYSMKNISGNWIKKV